MQQCPKCQSKDIHRSRSTSRWERWRKDITGKRLYRCRACNWRGWGPDSGPTFDERDVELAMRAMAPEPHPSGLRPASTLDLADLDPLTPPKPNLEKLDLPR